MKKLKIILPVVLTVLLGCLPLLAFFGILRLTPAQYDHTFYGELDEKHDRLSSIDKPKIVVVGGSSVAFGLDSQMIEEKTGYEVVNFGLYADLGTKIMLDLSRRHISEGDIVIIAPEMDEQTLSLYFNGSSALKATDGKPSMLFELDGDDWYDIWGALWGFAGEKWSYFKNGTPDPEGVYNSKNFNKYGDISPDFFKREENIMGLGYDTAKPLHISKEIFDGDFVEYLNTYIDTLTKKGATVYYGFCPMNEMAVQTDPDLPLSKEEQIKTLSSALVTYLEDTLHCPVLGTPEAAVMPSLYFYDSNFHLNDMGVPLHTARLVDDLLLAEQKTPVYATEQAKTEEGYVWNDECFVYEMLSDSTCAIVDTTQLAQTLKTLYVPNKVNEIPVSRIKAGAFDKCKALSTLLFGAGDSLQAVDEDAFKKVLSLTTFFIYCNPPTTFPSPDRLGDPNAVVFVPKDSLSLFETAPAFAGHTQLISTRIAEGDLFDQYMLEMEEVKNQGTVQTEDEYFIYTLLPGNTWEITGLTALGKTTDILIIPDTVKDDMGAELPVTSVGDYAMRGATSARALVVSSTSYISQFGRYVFAESSVDGLYMFVDCTNITTTVSKDMVIGAPSTFKIYIDDAARLDAYRTDYGWSTFTTDGYYASSSTGEEDLLSGNALPPVSEETKPLTQTAVVLAIVGVGLALGIGGYFLLCAKKRKRANAKEEF